MKYRYFIGFPFCTARLKRNSLIYNFLRRDRILNSTSYSSYIQLVFHTLWCIVTKMKP